MLEILALAESLPDKDTATILWICVCALAATVTGLAAYIRKLLIDHKEEIKKLSEAHATQVKVLGEAHAAAIQAVYDALSDEKEARREEMAGFLKQVIEVANEMARSVDANTKSQDRLSSLIEKWTQEE